MDGSQGSAIWFSFPYRPDLTWRQENSSVENFTSLQHLQLYRGITHDWNEVQGQEQEEEEGQEERKEQGKEQGLDQQPPQGSGTGGEGEGLCAASGHDAHQGQGLGLGQNEEEDGEREVSGMQAGMHDDDHNHDHLRVAPSPFSHDFTSVSRQITGQSTFDTILPGAAASR